MPGGRDRRFGEGRHPRVQRAGLAQQRHRQRRAAALAQAQAEVEQRLRRQGFEHMAMARLGTTVGEQQPVAAGRVQAHRAERRDALQM